MKQLSLIACAHFGYRFSFTHHGNRFKSPELCDVRTEVSRALMSSGHTRILIIIYKSRIRDPSLFWGSSQRCSNKVAAELNKYSSELVSCGCRGSPRMNKLRQREENTAATIVIIMRLTFCARQSRFANFLRPWRP